MNFSSTGSKVEWNLKFGWRDSSRAYDMHKMSPPCDICVSQPNVGSSDSLVIETLKRKTRDGELNSTMFET